MGSQSINKKLRVRRWVFSLLFIVGGLVNGGILSAQNLLPNPSFESNSGCPTNVGQVGNATGWSTPVGHGGSADYIHVCGTNPWVQVPNNAFGNQLPFQGNAYMGFALYYQSTPNFREYIQAPLVSPLVAGQTYEVSTYYSLGDQSTFATDKLQFYFSNVATTWGGGWAPMTTYVPQATIPTGTFLNDKVNWTRVSATFTAAGGEQFITIGNFLDDLSTPTQPAGAGTYTTCYVYLDSVSLRLLSPANSAPDTTLCLGACYQLWAVGDAPYTWTTTTNAVPFSNSDSVIVCPTTTTSYIVTGATTVDTITVTVLPTPPSINLGNDTTICQGQSVTLNAGVSGLTYLWSPGGATTQTITVNTTGNYSVTVSNSCGSTSDIRLVTVEPNPTPFLGNDTTICSGTSLSLDAGAGYASYLWSPGGSTSQTINVTTAGTYAVTVTTANGCQGSDAILINLSPPAPGAVNLGSDTTICQGQSVTLNAGISGMTYLWSPGGATTQSITVSTSGNYSVTVSNACGSSSDSRLVTVEALPTPFLGNDTSFCAGGNLLLNGGPGFASYLWSTNATTQTISVNASGTYSVTVTTSAGCQGSDAITVSVGLPLGLLVTSTNVTCNGGNNGTATALGSGSGPLTYVWSAPGAPTTPSISNLQAGTYFVTVTDAFGCTRVGSTTVTQPAGLTTSAAGQPESCSGQNNGTAWVTALGGVAPYSYLWSNGDNTANIDSLSPGTYFVTVTDNQGCTGTNSVVIGQAVGILATTSGNPTFCAGSGGDTLNVTASGGVGPYYYQWWCAVGPCGLDSIYDNDPLANPSASGWYYVQITDASGCQSNIDSIWVEVLPRPIVNAGPDIYLCGDNAPCQILNPVITGTAGPFTYQWLPSTGLNNAFIANPCARPDTTTIYALLVTAGNGCSSNFTTTDTLATVTVNVNPIPIANAGPDQHICFQDSAQLVGLGTGAGPAYGFEWTPSNGLANANSGITMASPALTTTYTLVAWSNGCPSYGDDMTLFVHTMPTVTAGPDREICLGDSILIDAMAGGDSTANFTFVWTPATNISDADLEDPTVWPASTTMYHVEAQSNYGCGSAFDSVLVTLLPSPIAHAGDNATICLGQEFQFQGSYSYTTTLPANPSNVFQYWTPAVGLSDANSLTPTATPTASGLYTLTVYTGLCSSQDSLLLTVIPDLGLTAEADTSTICAGDSVWLQVNSAVTGVNFSWIPAAGVAHPNAAGTFAAPATTTSYTVAANATGCVDSLTLNIAVIPTPVASYLQSQPQGCAPLTVSFMENTADAIAYSWNFGDGSPVTNVAAPTHTFDRPGTYTVMLTATNTGGCESTFQGADIVVSDLMVADFHTIPAFPIELSLPNTTVQFFNDVPNAASYDWDFGDGTHSTEENPVHSYAGPGNYQVTLTVSNAEGCITKIIGGPFVVSLPDLFIPNVFSPNGDGVNDEFLVQYTGSQPFNLQIFDRWGVKTFESVNKIKGWKGNDMKGLAVTDGIYYYRLKIGEREFTGPITLVR